MHILKEVLEDLLGPFRQRKYAPLARAPRRYQPSPLYHLEGGDATMVKGSAGSATLPITGMDCPSYHSSPLRDSSAYRESGPAKKGIETYDGIDGRDDGSAPATPEPGDDLGEDDHGEVDAEGAYGDLGYRAERPRYGRVPHSTFRKLVPDHHHGVAPECPVRMRLMRSLGRSGRNGQVGAEGPATWFRRRGIWNIFLTALLIGMFPSCSRLALARGWCIISIRPMGRGAVPIPRAAEMGCRVWDRCPRPIPSAMPRKGYGLGNCGHWPCCKPRRSACPVIATSQQALGIWVP